MTVAFIPIRSESKSIPNKNVKLFAGEPLVYWSVKATSDSPMIDRVFVAVDCDEYEQIINSFDLPKVSVYRRDPKNAQDSSQTEDVMLEFLSSNTIELTNEDVFVLVQATNPLFIPSQITQALNIYEKESYNSMISCSEFKRFFWNTDKNDVAYPCNYNYQHRPLRQEWKGSWIENGIFYINKVKYVIQDKCRLTSPVGMYKMPEWSSIEIDNEYDWAIAENRYSKYIIKKDENKNMVDENKEYDHTCFWCRSIIHNKTSCQKDIYLCRSCSVRNIHPKIRMTEEWKRKISIANKGKRAWSKGKTGFYYTEDRGRKVSDNAKHNPNFGMKGKKASELTIFRKKENAKRNPNYGMKNKKHSEESKRKMRIRRAQDVMCNYGQWVNYNKKACEFFKKFDKKMNTQGQYALYGGGEFCIDELGYFVDYINFDLKLIIEWDEELHHYKEGNLIEKDIQRQKEIQEVFPAFRVIRIREKNFNEDDFLSKWG